MKARLRTCADIIVLLIGLGLVFAGGFDRGWAMKPRPQLTCFQYHPWLQPPPARAS